MSATVPDLRLRIERGIGPTFASDLNAHFARGVVFMVDPGLSLIDVATAVAEDNVERVQEWISGGLLRRPAAASVARWADAPETPFTSVVVEPYVLAQVCSEVEPELH